MEKSESRLKVLKKIEELEKKQLWTQDVEDDPETYELLPNKVDYLNKKLSSKILNKIANIAGTKFFEKMIKNKQLIIEKINGIENPVGFLLDHITLSYVINDVNQIDDPIILEIFKDKS